MKISPVTGPGAVQDKSTPEHVRTARAVEAFNKASAKAEPIAPTQGQAQETLVADPNNVSVEELSALNVQTEEVAEGDTGSDIEATEPIEEKTKEDPALSRQFAQLARQERGLRAKAQQQDQAYKARLSELEAREAALANRAAFDPKDYIPRSRLQQDALGTLEAEGIATYEQLTERAVSRVPVDPVLQQTIEDLRAKINDLTSNVEKSGKAYEEQQAQSYQAAVKQITSDAVALVKSNPTEYEAISKTGTVKEIVKLIEKTYAKDGIVMSVEEAAQEVENYLVEENYRMASNIDKIKKRMAAANASQATSEVKTQATQQQTQGKMKTLTNAASSSRQLSAKERAILAFKGELKS